jgi:hypothetical protein
MEEKRDVQLDQKIKVYLIAANEIIHRKASTYHNLGLSQLQVTWGYIQQFNTTCAQPLRKALLNGLPVDDLPDRLEVFGLAVLVLQAAYGLAEKNNRGDQRHLLVGVLPSINTKEGLELSNNGVLVLKCDLDK